MCLDFFNIFRTSLVAQMVKNLLAMQETWVQSLGWEAPLEKEMATYSSILAWRISWTVIYVFMPFECIPQKVKLLGHVQLYA